MNNHVDYQKEGTITREILETLRIQRESLPVYSVKDLKQDPHHYATRTSNDQMCRRGLRGK